MNPIEALINIVAVDKASKAFDDVGDAAGELSGGIGGLKGVAETAAGVLGGLLARDALGAVKDQLKECIDSFASFERTITEITALSGLAEDEAMALGETLSDVALTMGVEFGVGANEAASALNSLVKAGLEGDEAINALASTLQMATIEQMASGEAADLLVGVMGQFKISAEDSTRAVDALVNASAVGVDTASDFALGLSYCGGQAASMGFTLEETTAALVEMNNQGIAAEKAGRYLGAMFTDLVKKSDDLGFSVYNANGSMKSLSEIVGLLQGKLSSLETQEKRNNYLTEVFGSQSIRAANALLNLGDEGTSASEAMMKSAEAIGKAGTASDVTSKLLDTTSGALAKMDAKWEEVQIMIGEKLAPVLTKLMDALIKFVDFVWPAVEVALTGISTLLNAVINAFNLEAWSNFFGEISRGFNVIMAPAVESFKDVWDGAWNWIGSITGWVWDNLLKPIFDAIDSVLNGVDSTVNTFKDAWDKAWNAIGDVLKWVWDHTIGPIIDSLKGALDVMGDVAEGLGNIVGGVGDAIGDTMDGIGDAIGDTLGDLFGSGIWEEHLLKMSHYTEENLGAVEKQFTSTMNRIRGATGEGIMVGVGFGATPTAPRGRGGTGGGGPIATSMTINISLPNATISPDNQVMSQLMRRLGVEAEREIRRRQYIIHGGVH